MPIAQIYLTDEEYVKYVERKEELNKKARDTIKEEINKEGE